MKTALITGITGQDGPYLAEFLLGKGYRVIGLSRGSAPDLQGKFEVRKTDYLDLASLDGVLKDLVPDEIYHLAGQSRVGGGMGEADTLNGNVRVTMNLLKVAEKRFPSARVFNASSSYIFAQSERPIRETDPIGPYNIYGISKAAAYFMCRMHRSDRGAFIANAFLFNHESSRRGKDFVTTKIVEDAIAIARGRKDHMEVGNLDVVRDWGHAKEYVPAFWKMLQAPTPEDYVLATGKGRTVRDLVGVALKKTGLKFEWSNGQHGTNVLAVEAGTSRPLVVLNPAFVRGNDPKFLVGDIGKASRELGHAPRSGLEEIVDEIHAHYLTAGP